MHAVSSPAVLDVLGAGFAVLGADGEVVEANQRARELLDLGLVPGSARTPLPVPAPGADPGPSGSGPGPTGGADADPGRDQDGAAGPRWVDVSGTPVGAGNHPLRQVLRTGEPARGVVIGVGPGTPQARWIRLDVSRIDPGSDRVAALMLDVTAETERSRESARAADRASRLMAPVADVICRLDAGERFLDVSASSAAVLGFAPEDLFGRRLAGLVHVDGAEAVRAAIAAARGGGTGQALVRVRRSDGELRWADLQLRRVDGPDGTPGADSELHLVLRDVHDRVRAERERAEADRRYRLIADNTGDLVCGYDAAGRLVYVSPSVLALLGHRPEDLLGRDIADLVHPEDRGTVGEVCDEVRATGRPGTCRHRLRRADRGWGWVETTWRAVAGTGTVPPELHSASRDVTDRIHRDDELAVAEQTLRLTVETARHGMARLSPDGRILQANPALAALAGRPVGELEGRMLRVLTALKDPDPVAALRARLAGSDGDELRREQRVVRPDGSEVWVDLTLDAVRDGTGAIRYLVARLVDLTAERVLGEQLRRLDEHDPLTAVGTAAVLDGRLAACLADPRQRRLALVRLDLDGFRRLNEVRGRLAGDTVLVVTAQRLVAAVREADLVARIGADEFAVLCPGVDRDYVERLGQRISRALTCSVTGVGHVSVSVGVVTARPGDGPPDVLARAEAALSVVRRTGGGGWAVD
jgi:diguanylate cyclase (GGDEF)-like protein/PAS domain S-box-containing protein